MRAKKTPPSESVADLESARSRIADLEQRLSELESTSRESRAREAQFRVLSELVADCCWVRWKSRDGGEERGWINDAFTELTGYTPEEFETVTRLGLVHPDDLEKVLDFVDGPSGVDEHEFRIVRKDGQVRWLHERIRVREEEAGKTVFGATRDITEEKKAAELVLDHRQQLERRVAERTAELVVLNRQLEHEVAERRQIAAELRRAKDAAEASNLAKSRFLANMTHELRTPLHGIVGLSDLLLEIEIPESARSWVGTLQSSARALQHLVQEVLDLSKIEAEQLVLEPEAFAPRELLEDLCELLREKALGRGNALECEIDSRVPGTLIGDANRLRQVLLNLIDNALKFTEAGTVEARIDPVAAPSPSAEGPRQRLRFAVRDTGSGISEQERERIFDPFTQVDSSSTRAYGGTGLGLAISQRLVDLLGGTLEVESEPGRGSVFSFVLEWDAEPDADLADEAPSMLDGRGRRILVAEDNPVNQMVVDEQLKALGFEVDMVSDGQQAIDALSRGRGYDAWLLDCHMPVMDGFEAVKQWRLREVEGERLPVIAITASAVRDELDACLEAGMDGLLTKPFRLQDLASTLERWLS